MFVYFDRLFAIANKRQFCGFYEGLRNKLKAGNGACVLLVDNFFENSLNKPTLSGEDKLLICCFMYISGIKLNYSGDLWINLWIT